MARAKRKELEVAMEKDYREIPNIIERFKNKYSGFITEIEILESQAMSGYYYITIYKL